MGIHRRQPTWLYGVWKCPPSEIALPFSCKSLPDVWSGIDEYEKFTPTHDDLEAWGLFVEIVILVWVLCKLKETPGLYSELRRERGREAPRSTLDIRDFIYLHRFRNGHLMKVEAV